MIKKTKDKKAAVEGLAWALATIALFIIIIIALIFSNAITKTPARSQILENYATSRENFEQEKYIPYRSREDTTALQSLLNTEADVKSDDEKTVLKKMTLKDALIEWAEDPKTRPFIDSQGNLNSISTGAGGVLSTLPQQMIGKSIGQYYTDPSGGKKYTCYYFEAVSTRNGKIEKTYYINSQAGAYGLGSSQTGDYQLIKNTAQSKAAYLNLKTPDGYIDIYLYYKNGEC